MEVLSVITFIAGFIMAASFGYLIGSDYNDNYWKKKLAELTDRHDKAFAEQRQKYQSQIDFLIGQKEDMFVDLKRLREDYDRNS